MSSRPPPTIPRPRLVVVVPDTGPDGQPQAMMCTPTAMTVLDVAAALHLIEDLLAAVTG